MEKSLALAKEVIELTREQKELAIYKMFFMQDRTFLEDFENDWGYIYNGLCDPSKWNFQLEKMPEAYINFLYEWCQNR